MPKPSEAIPAALNADLEPGESLLVIRASGTQVGIFKTASVAPSPEGLLTRLFINALAEVAGPLFAQVSSQSLATLMAAEKRSQALARFREGLAHRLGKVSQGEHDRGTALARRDQLLEVSSLAEVLPDAGADPVPPAA